MLRSRTVRALGALALAGAATLGGISLAGPTSASTTLKIKCTTLTGNAFGNVTLSGCTQAATGGSSLPIPGANLVGGGTIMWVNGKSTTVSLTANATETDADLHGTCPSTTTEYEAIGTVTADTTGYAAVGGKAKAEACLDTVTADLSLEPGSALKLK